MKKLEIKIERSMQSVKDFAMKELERCNKCIENTQKELDSMKNYVSLYEIAIRFIESQISENALSDKLSKDE